MYTFIKSHLIKAFSTTLQSYTSFPPPQTYLISLCWRRQMPCSHIFFWRISQHDFFFRLKLYITVPGHISHDIVLTCLVISTTFLVYLSIYLSIFWYIWVYFGIFECPILAHPSARLWMGDWISKPGAPMQNLQCLRLGCFVAAVPFLLVTNELIPVRICSKQKSQLVMITIITTTIINSIKTEKKAIFSIVDISTSFYLNSLKHPVLFPWLEINFCAIIKCSPGGINCICISYWSPIYMIKQSGTDKPLLGKPLLFDNICLCLRQVKPPETPGAH